MSEASSMGVTESYGSCTKCSKEANLGNGLCVNCWDGKPVHGIEEMAKSMLPSLMNDGFGETTEAKRADYLSKRVCNFSVRESCKLANVSEKSVRRWRDADPHFLHLDTEGMTELRKNLSTQLIDMEFTRNFHLILQKDFRILYKDAIDVPLSDKENDYLMKIRQHYTPQSLAMVKQLLGGGTVDQPFDFTRLTMEIKREQITITQERQSGLPEVQQLHENSP